MSSPQLATQPQAAGTEQPQPDDITPALHPTGIFRRALGSLCQTMFRGRRQDHSEVTAAALSEMAERAQISQEQSVAPLATVQEEVELTPSQDAAQETLGEQNETSPTEQAEDRLYCCLCYEKFPRGKLTNVCKSYAQDLWCDDCIKRAFINAIEGSECQPAKCHSIIQLHYATPLISEEVAAKYQSRFDIWVTKDRTYCPVPSCSAFIAQRLIDAATDKNSQSVGRLSCPGCHSLLCIQCKGLSHPNEECASTDVDVETLAALKKWGYKRCPKCKDAIRKMYGCRHIRCLCGASWCWICLLPIDDCDGDCDYASEDDDGEEGEPDDGSSGIRGPDPWSDMLEEGVELPRLFDEEYIRDTPLEITQTPEPRRRLRRRLSNLDGRPDNYWRTRQFNFGDEPTNNGTDHIWCCSHNFEKVVPAAFINPEAAEERHYEAFYCHRCWKSFDMAGVKECLKCHLMYCVDCVER